MWVRDADDALAERLGVLRETPHPEPKPMVDEDGLKADPPANMDAALATDLERTIGKGAAL
jgi:hypothetical protein